MTIAAATGVKKQRVIRRALESANPGVPLGPRATMTMAIRAQLDSALVAFAGINFPMRKHVRQMTIAIAIGVKKQRVPQRATENANPRRTTSQLATTTTQIPAYLKHARATLVLAAGDRDFPTARPP